MSSGNSKFHFRSPIIRNPDLRSRFEELEAQRLKLAQQRNILIQQQEVVLLLSQTFFIFPKQLRDATAAECGVIRVRTLKKAKAAFESQCKSAKVRNSEMLQAMRDTTNVLKRGLKSSRAAQLERAKVTNVLWFS